MTLGNERMIWLTAVCLIGVVSWKLGGRERPETPESAQSAEIGENASFGLGNERGQDRRRQTSARPGAIPADGVELRDFTIRVLRSSDPVRRASGFLRILESATPENYYRISEAWKELRFSGSQLLHEEVLMNFRAGELMGRKILENRTGTARDLSMMHALKPQYRGWVKSDSGDARRWLDELPEGEYRKQMTLTYIGALAEDNPTGSLGEIAALPEEYQASAGGSIISQLRLSGSIDHASKFLATQAAAGKADSLIFRGMFDTLVGGTVDGNGELMGRLIEEHAGQPYVSQHWMQRAASLRGQRDEKTPEVLAWALRVEEAGNDLPPGTILTATTSGMTAGKLAEAAKWVEQQPGGQAVDALRAVIEARQSQLAPKEDDPPQGR